MNLRDLKSATHEEWDFIYKQYELTFPVDERRNKEQFYQLFKNENTYIISIDSVEKISMGYFVTWPFENFLFVEFFEIYAIFRSTGMGTRALKKLKDRFKVIVLETEPPEMGATARNRIMFYENNGFQIIDKHYRQPAYDITKNSPNLYLVATEPVELNTVKSEIYRRVYGVKM